MSWQARSNTPSQAQRKARLRSGGAAKEDKPKQEKQSLRTQRGPVFAVVVPVLVGGPLALLAMLFPAVFGGLTGQLRRWLALLSIASLNSTLYFLYGWSWFYSLLKGSWWGSPLALWIIMSLSTVAGTLWAWRRQVKTLQQDPASAQVPQRGEYVALLVMSLLGMGLVVYLLLKGQSLLASPWKILLVLWIGIWVGTLYVLYLRLVRRHSAISVEGVVLGAMALACTALMAALPRTSAIGAAEVAETSGHRVTQGSVSLKFEAQYPGSMYSSPRVIGDLVYIGAAHEGNPFSKQRTPGAVYCLARDKDNSDREIFKTLWKFDDDHKMTQVFSSPCLARVHVTPEKEETLLYIGEGFHNNDNCKFFCLKTDTGQKLWEFSTKSHTESSPCVADGKVFFGAGDDGLYCVDAATGTELWHFADRLHIDANPVAVGNRLYCGGGVVGEAEHKRSAIFCLDVGNNGNQIWQHDTDLPVMCGRQWPANMSSSAWATATSAIAIPGRPEPCSAWPQRRARPSGATT